MRHRGIKINISQRTGNLEQQIVTSNRTEDEQNIRINNFEGGNPSQPKYLNFNHETRRRQK